jgi:hypothetical protein
LLLNSSSSSEKSATRSANKQNKIRHAPKVTHWLDSHQGYGACSLCVPYRPLTDNARYTVDAAKKQVLHRTLRWNTCTATSYPAGPGFERCPRRTANSTEVFRDFSQSLQANRPRQKRVTTFPINNFYRPLKFWVNAFKYVIVAFFHLQFIIKSEHFIRRYKVYSIEKAS